MVTFHSPKTQKSLWTILNRKQCGARRDGEMGAGGSKALEPVVWLFKKPDAHRSEDASTSDNPWDALTDEQMEALSDEELDALLSASDEDDDDDDDADEDETSDADTVITTPASSTSRAASTPTPAPKKPKATKKAKAPKGDGPIANALGAQVIATAGGAKKCGLVEALGAHHVIDYQATDFASEVRKITGKAGVQVVFEHVGEATFGGSLKCLQRGGRVVTCGATTGGDVGVSLHQVFFKSLSILGSTMGSKGDLRRVLRMFEQGRLRPVLDRAMPMSEVADAHRLLEERRAMGKVVLTV